MGDKYKNDGSEWILRQARERAAAAAAMEMKMMADAMGRMMDTCFKKCVADFSENDLHVGEMSCLDRCVFKYSNTQTKVIKKLQEHQASEQEAMQQQMDQAANQQQAEKELTKMFGG